MWTVLGIGAIGSLLGFLLPLLFAKFLPNEKFYGWGKTIGSKLSAFLKGSVVGSSWEKIENTVIGSLIAFVTGLQDGADSDDL